MFFYETGCNSPTIEGGNATVVEKPRSEINVVGTIVRLECDEGGPIVELFCNADGTWTGGDLSTMKCLIEI